MKKRLIHLIAGARPNFMKIAPIFHALKKENWCEVVLIHTGQHYSKELSDSFFQDFSLPQPHFNLEVGSGPHGEQTAKVLMGYEKLILEKSRPDLVVVVGDVNSTLACCLAAKKLNIKVAHIEAGLRSRDWTMPEEINRLATDAISDYLFTPSKDGNENLTREGVSPSRIFFVGNVMIDAYEMLRGKIKAKDLARSFGLEQGGYGVVTLHRPSNVDSNATLKSIVDSLGFVSRETPLVFPVHPRTQKNLKDFGLWEKIQAAPFQIKCLDPLSYIEFMSLVEGAKFVLTDSGGVQEETTYLGIPCLTLRENTERPITVTEGSNQLISAETLRNSIQLLRGSTVRNPPPTHWDGKAADRIVESFRELLIPQAGQS